MLLTIELRQARWRTWPHFERRETVASSVCEKLEGSVNLSIQMLQSSSAIEARTSSTGTTCVYDDKTSLEGLEFWSVTLLHIFEDFRSDGGGCVNLQEPFVAETVVDKGMVEEASVVEEEAGVVGNRVEIEEAAFSELEDELGCTRLLPEAPRNDRLP